MNTTIRLNIMRFLISFAIFCAAASALAQTTPSPPVGFIHSVLLTNALEITYHPLPVPPGQGNEPHPFEEVIRCEVIRQEQCVAFRGDDPAKNEVIEIVDPPPVLVATVLVTNYVSIAMGNRMEKGSAEAVLNARALASAGFRRVPSRSGNSLLFINAPVAVSAPSAVPGPLLPP